MGHTHKSQLMTSKSIDIPAKLRAQHPDYDISQSVGGTIYATTPGGTKIVYNRAELMHLSKSPLARDRPLDMPDIPGITSASPRTSDKDTTKGTSNGHHSKNDDKTTSKKDDDTNDDN